LERFTDAYLAFNEALKLEPNNPEVKKLLENSKKKGEIEVND